MLKHTLILIAQLIILFRLLVGSIHILDATEYMIVVAILTIIQPIIFAFTYKRNREKTASVIIMLLSLLPPIIYYFILGYASAMGS